MADRKITPCIWSDDRIAAQAKFYASVFPNSKIGATRLAQNRRVRCIWASGFTIRMAIAGSFRSKAANRSVGAARKLRFVLWELNCERDARTHRGVSKMGCGRFRRGLCPDETLRGQPYS